MQGVHITKVLFSGALQIICVVSGALHIPNNLDLDSCPNNE